MVNPYTYLEPMPRFNGGYGQAPPQALGPAAAPPAPPMSAPLPPQPAQAPGWVPASALGPIGQFSAVVVQELRNLFGIRLDRNEEMAWLTFDVAPLAVPAAATNIRGVMTVGQEADFVATGVVVQTVDSTAGPPNTLLAPNSLRFQILDGSTNRQFQRASMPISFLALTQAGFPAGSRPWFAAKPRIFSRNSNVIWILDNVPGFPAQDVDIAFFGYRIYDIDALDLTRVR